MNTRRLGKTGLFVSEIGFGGEWLERHPEEEGVALIRYAASKGVNLLDCWTPNRAISSARAFTKTAPIGSFRATSAPHGRTVSISAHAICGM